LFILVPSITRVLEQVVSASSGNTFHVLAITALSGAPIHVVDGMMVSSPLAKGSRCARWVVSIAESSTKHEAMKKRVEVIQSFPSIGRERLSIWIVKCLRKFLLVELLGKKA
jgi:hypothetical protein